MRPEITAVQNIREVSAFLTLPNSRIIAGGTTFSPDPEEELHLVDISGLEGLDGIKQKGTGIELGPLTTLSTIAGSMLLKAYAPALAASAAAADPSIRDRGTLGGNLASIWVGDCAVALMASGAKLTIKTGSDFREILIDMRMQQAVHLLITTDQSAEAIAAAVGYTSLSGFYYIFQKKLGMTAEEYRRLYASS